MEVEILREQLIKPSSPTPVHLKTYKISLLDQWAPSLYFPLILVYSNLDPNHDYNERSKRLKQSLSETLTCFYPFSGKIKDNLSVDCNDEGVRYVEARVNIPLCEYLARREYLMSSSKLLAKEAGLRESVAGSYVVMIQETSFVDGGFAIGVSASHLVMDGISLASFLKHWAAITCDASEELISPNFDNSTMFQQYDAFPKEANSMTMNSRFIKVGRTSIKRFVFDASAITALKEKAISLGVENPTRVEVVTALFIKSLKAISNTISKTENPLASNHVVNLRRRAVPPFGDSSIGNMILLAATLCKSKEANLSSLIYNIREAIGKINGENVKKLQGDGGFAKLSEMVDETKRTMEPSGLCGGVEYVMFTSWCNFGLYEVDFGWGKPTWATNTADFGSSETMFLNVIRFMDAKEEKGVEAWVLMESEVVLWLEKDESLLAYACADPVPLP